MVQNNDAPRRMNGLYERIIKIVTERKKFVRKNKLGTKYFLNYWVFLFNVIGLFNLNDKYLFNILLSQLRTIQNFNRRKTFTLFHQI